jgi:PIN domain nuclease of toxin-antitoxin system
MILLDTHIISWLALEPGRLSKGARSAIEASRRTGQGLAISAISLFELAMAAKRRRIKLDISIESFLQDIESHFILLPIVARTCVRAAELPPAYPRDPADLIIGATALTEGIPLVTADQAIRRSGALQTIW